MAGIYFGVGGVARKVKNVYIGVSSVARKVKNGYIGVAGVARKFFSGFYTSVWLDGAEPMSYEVTTSKMYLKSQATGISNATVLWLKIDGDCSGKTISFEYTNTKYNGNNWVVAFDTNVNDSWGDRILLTETSSWTSKSMTIPNNCSFVAFTFWAATSGSGTLSLRNIKIGGEAIE